jgi:hypothetical protein
LQCEHRDFPGVRYISPGRTIFALSCASAQKEKITLDAVGAIVTVENGKTTLDAQSIKITITIEQEER